MHERDGHVLRFNDEMMMMMQKMCMMFMEMEFNWGLSKETLIPPHYISTINIPLKKEYLDIKDVKRIFW